MDDWSNWWTQVPPEWQFLFVLPFFVVAVALIANRGNAGESAPAPARMRRPHKRRARAHS
jgi:hypothetical protein